MDDAGWLDALGQAELVRTRKVSPAELVEAAAARADEADRALSFLIERTYDQAARQATGVARESPLAGVPMLVKDHLATIEGVRHTSGSRYLRDHVAGADSELVRRYKVAGLIPIGTSATCEFALISTAESERYGPCRNPWDPQLTAGGS